MKGFSLVELMVVVTVIMVLAGMGAVSLSKFNHNQNLDERKEELISDFKLARNMAITNQLPSNVTSGSLKYIRITLNSGISVSADAILVGSESNPRNYFSKKNESIRNTASFGFSIENGRLMNGNGVFVSSPVCFTLYLNEDTNDKKYVKIDTSGLIYEEDNCN